MPLAPPTVADDVPAVENASRRRRRAWLLGHLATLVIAGGLIVRAMRGQWFYYDEWDFLREDAEWALLMPHNGHLSLLPRLVTTLIKGVAGLHEYWPYLIVTVLVHLLLAHLLWRLMLRTGANLWLATIAVFGFALLAPGSENVLWAFQVGFILPLVTGTAAFLIAMSATLRRRDVAAIVVLLLAGLFSSGTALPMTAGVLLFMLVRHGWRRAVLAGAILAVPYGAWFFTFGMLPQGTSAFRAGSLNDVLVRVPEYFAHGLIDGIGKTLPFPALAGLLLLALLTWMLLDLRRTGVRRLSVVHYLVFAALLFGALTAITRVQLPVESASAGRYVYVYAALLLPAAVSALTVLVARSRATLAVVSVLLAALAAYNVGGFMREAHVQSELELRVQGRVSAALELDDGSAEVAGRRPDPVWAPPLTMEHVREFVARGQFEPIEPTAADLLAARANLYLTIGPAERPTAAECAPAAEGDLVRLDPALPLVASPGGASTRLSLDGGGTQEFVELDLAPGTTMIAGLEGVDVSVEITDPDALCVLVTDESRAGTR
jgi:hypothetical protein